MTKVDEIKTPNEVLEDENDFAVIIPKHVVGFSMQALPALLSTYLENNPDANHVQTIVQLMDCMQPFLSKIYNL